MKLTRAETIIFERVDGTVIVAPAVTRGQIRETLMLELKPTDTPLEGAARRGEMMAVFLRDAAWLQADRRTPAGMLPELLDALTVVEEIEMINAFVAQHHGIRPDTAVQVQQALFEVLKKKPAEPGRRRRNSSRSTTK